MFSSDTLVAELLNRSHQAATILIDLHVKCIGCSMNEFCTLEDMCKYYDLDPSHLLKLFQETLDLNVKEKPARSIESSELTE